MKKLTLNIIVLFISISVSYSQWQPDVQLTNDPGASLTSDNNTWCVAADGDVVHVIWYDNRDGNTEIYYKRSIDGGTNWGADTRLTNDTADSWQPSIAVSGQFVHVVWYDYRNVNSEIYYKRSTDGGVSWGADTRLTNSTDESQWSSVTVSGQVVHVVWNSRAANLINNIYYRRSTDGGSSWGAIIQLTNNNSAYMGYPSISVSGQSVHVVMEDIRTSSYWDIFYIRSIDGGSSWGAGTWLTNSTGHSWFPCVSASGSSVNVVFFSTRDANKEIYYKRSTDGGSSWGADTRLTNNNYDSEWPSVSASGSRVHLVWVSAGELMYKLSTDGGTSWGASTQISNVYQYPSVTVFGSAVHVVWTAANFEIFYKRNPTGNAIGITNISSEFPVNYNLFQNYPNPFNPTTKIKFSIPPLKEVRGMTAKLTIYDVLGREISTLVNQQLNPGTYEVEWNASNYPSGIYFYKLVSDKYSETKRMVLLK